jgi:hypothetical protein
MRTQFRIVHGAHTSSAIAVDTAADRSRAHQWAPGPMVS